uniref:Probable membrane transporter protein n=1 Tax=OCS116 cluster bacterium TaxID=2030921 RepID=A0A2A4YSJ1_9PROT
MQVLGFDVTELLILISALIGAGLIAGVLAGLLGVGGGVILVPVLFQVFTFIKIDPDIVMHLSVGTSLATIIPTSIRSVKSHMAKGAVDVDLLKTWAVPVLIGTLFGSIIAAYADGFWLKAVFSGVVSIVGIKLLFGKEDWVLAKDIPFGWVNNLIAWVMGMFSTLMGIGGGTFAVTYMTLSSRKIHQAIATSSGLGLLISVPATLGYIVSGWSEPALPAMSLGFVNLWGVALIIPATVFAAPLGVKLAHSFSRRTLEITFALLLFSVSIRFGMSLM